MEKLSSLRLSPLTRLLVRNPDEGEFSCILDLSQWIKATSETNNRVRNNLLFMLQRDLKRFTGPYLDKF